METPLHPDLAPVAFLAGRWRGHGRGDYPTIQPFAYEEEIEFRHGPKPFLVYHQRTWDAESREPLHTETGYVRVPSRETAELVIAQPTGIAEIHQGRIAGTTIRFRSLHVTRTSTAKEVTAVERDLFVDGDTLRYELRMAAVGHPLQFHLEARLHRA